MAEKTGSKAVKAGIGYTIGNLFVKGINFITLPIFSRLLTTTEFGIYNVFLSYEAILSIILSIALHTSMKSAKLEFKEKLDDYTSSIILIYMINTIIFSIFVVIFGQPLSELMNLKSIELLLLVFFSFGCGVMNLYNSRISLDYSFKEYLVIAMINAIGNIVLSLALITTVYKDNKDFGRIVGVTAVISIISIILLWRIFSKAKPHYNRNYWSFGIKYSLPIVPHGISQVLLAQCDRIMIRSMIGAAEAGIFSLAGNIRLIFTIISDSIVSAWGTWFYEQLEIGNIKYIQKRAVQLCAIFVIFTVGLMALSPELVLVIGGKAYVEGKYVAVPMILDAFILFLYSMVVQGEYYAQKTIYVMYGTVIAAIINVITNYIFIKKFDYIAAAYTTLFSYVCYLIVHVIISYRLMKVYILSLKWMFSFILIVVASAVLDIIFIDLIIIRCGICVFTVISVGGIFLKMVYSAEKH